MLTLRAVVCLTSNIQHWWDTVSTAVPMNTRATLDVTGTLVMSHDRSVALMKQQVLIRVPFSNSCCLGDEACKVRDQKIGSSALCLTAK